jgi:hypothetical protein
VARLGREGEVSFPDTAPQGMIGRWTRNAVFAERGTFSPLAGRTRSFFIAGNVVPSSAIGASGLRSFLSYFSAAPAVTNADRRTSEMPKHSSR